MVTFCLGCDSINLLLFDTVEAPSDCLLMTVSPQIVDVVDGLLVVFKGCCCCCDGGVMIFVTRDDLRRRDVPENMRS